ncbi:Acylphosphatase-like domain-containing protein [Sparassis latifolia]
MSYFTFDYIISGRVQGVSFRAFARHAAHEYGIVGWVRNDDKGNVIGVAQGEYYALLDLSALHTGPRHARIRHVEISNERALEVLEYDAFEVRQH